MTDLLLAFGDFAPLIVQVFYFAVALTILDLIVSWFVRLAGRA